MGTSTDGQLSFGSPLSEEELYPWDDHDSTEEWWEVVNGYENPYGWVWDSEGNYNKERGIQKGSPEIRLYLDFRSQWNKEHPIPFSLVNTCSGDYPMLLFAVDNYVASRGYPNDLDLDKLIEKTPELTKIFENLVERYKIHVDPPKWWLSSYWG